jgi:uncharacterized protein
MVFDGGWRSRGRRYRPGQGPQGPPGSGPDYDPSYGPGYDPRYNQGYGRRSGFGYGRGFGGGYGSGGGSCLRDMLLMEGGCCLAESLGCGPSLVLLAPTLGRHALHRTHEPALSHRTGTHGRLARFLLALIELYQSDISPRRPARCRFTPTCSHFAAQAVQAHGAWRGGRLAARRLLRCRPGAAGGPDPVPGAATAA